MTMTANVVVTNPVAAATTKTTEATVQKIGAGGLSGDPVRQRSTAVIRYLSEQSNHKLTIIGVGGISTFDVLSDLSFTQLPWDVEH